MKSLFLEEQWRSIESKCTSQRRHYENDRIGEEDESCTVYKNDCGLCVKAKQVLQEVQCEYSFQIEEIDIYEDNDLLEKYHLMIPVVEIDGKQVEYGNIHKGVIINYIKNAVKS